MTSSAELEARAKMVRASESGTIARPVKILVFPTYNGGELIVDPAEVAAIVTGPTYGAFGDPPEKWPTMIIFRSGTQFLVDLPLAKVREPLVAYWGVAWPSDQA